MTFIFNCTSNGKEKITIKKEYDDISDALASFNQLQEIIKRRNKGEHVVLERIDSIKKKEVLHAIKHTK